MPISYALLASLAVALVLVPLGSVHLRRHDEARPSPRAPLLAQGRYARVLQVMKPNIFYSPVVLCPNVIEDRPPEGTDSIVCLSGGVDSTYAAMVRAEAFKYAMFVRGAAYPLSATNILEGLAQRATRICRSSD